VPLPPGGLIATGEVVDAIRAEMPHLGRDFRLLDPAFAVTATDGIVVATWVIEPDAPQADACTPKPGPDASGDGTRISPNKGTERTR
jgi:hypothetical protein